MGVERIRLLQN